MRVTMIGAGYVGLVSGACFADFGHTVTCVDKDPGKIDAPGKGRDADFRAGPRRAGRLQREGRPAVLLAGCARTRSRMRTPSSSRSGTPSRRGDGHADLSYVYAAAKEIAEHMDGFTVVVTKSTVPVGTGDEVEEIIRKTNPNAKFAVVSNPEFLREGAAISDFKRPDRVVVGTDNEEARERMRELYRPLFLNETPITVHRAAHVAS